LTTTRSSDNTRGAEFAPPRPTCFSCGFELIPAEAGAQVCVTCGVIVTEESLARLEWREPVRAERPPPALPPPDPVEEPPPPLIYPRTFQ